MSDRAKNSGFREELLGSKRFPNDLVNLCCLHDPKGILYGTAPLPSSLPLTAQERERLRSLLDERGLRDKKILLLSGADDPLVPYAHTRPLVKVLEDVGGVPLEDKVYDGVKHWFTADMVQDAVRFLVQAVEAGPRTASKI
jgi:predicted esterase